jgi:hypothetical protein
LGDKATEEHDVFSTEKLALYCCINGLQISSPALLQLPRIIITERPCTRSPETEADGERASVNEQQVDVHVASLEGCLSLQVLEPVVRIITTRMAELEASQGGGSSEVQEEPNARGGSDVLPPWAIRAEFALGCVVLQLRDEEGATPALVMIQVRFFVIKSSGCRGV